jgi:hypothetical protein
MGWVKFFFWDPIYMVPMGFIHEARLGRWGSERMNPEIIRP